LIPTIIWGGKLYQRVPKISSWQLQKSCKFGGMTLVSVALGLQI